MGLSRFKDRLRLVAGRLPPPLAEGGRWLWRRIPPADARFALQDLESEAKRRAFLASPAYARFAEQEGRFWGGEEEKNSAEPTAPQGNPLGEDRPRLRRYTDHPLVQREMHRRAWPGEPDIWQALARRFQNLDRALVLGAGRAAHARLLIDLKIARSVTAYDIAEPMVRAVRESLAAEGYPVDYRLGDLNFVDFNEERFDLALAMHALHHLIDLESLFRRLARALSPSGGLLVAEDYVGPQYLEFPPSVRDAAQAWLERLPEHLRLDPLGRAPLRRVPFGDRWWSQKHSPFESIRSEAILPALREAFEIEQLRPLGGLLLLTLGNAVIHNFDPEREEDNAWIERLLEADRSLTEDGSIPNGIVFLIARPKKQ